jgi:hypothetical protein
MTNNEATAPPASVIEIANEERGMQNEEVGNACDFCVLRFAFFVRALGSS